MDERLRGLFDKTVPAPEQRSGAGHGLALVAVGGYGRAALSPQSDVDVVLVHDDALSTAQVDETAASLWYPLWDDGVALDHAVRSTSEMMSTAATDYRAAMGLLDARAVAGDASLVLTLRSRVLAAWRREARTRLPELRAATEERIDRVGLLAHAAVPDLKESGGGLRDLVTLRALVATWLVDVPHRELEYLHRSLLDVRDVVHTVTGRRTERLSPDVVADAAEQRGEDPIALDLRVRGLGRLAAHLSTVTWRRLDAALDERPRVRRPTGAPRLVPLAPGVAALDDEVVLAPDAKPAEHPLVALRAAAESAESGRILSPSTAVRLAATSATPPEPWSPEANRLMVDLLASGERLVAVWEELDLSGVVDLWLPEWAAIRLRGSSSPVHRYTVDRHSIEACVVAAGLLRDVSRPDLVVVAALLHDIGKGLQGDHSVVGAPVAERIALRWGFDAEDARRIGVLVRWHLLLPTVATRRDIEDPATVANVAEIVGDVDTLELLAAVTQADARATSATAWSSWRAGLIAGLVAKVRVHLGGRAGADDHLAYDGWPTHGPEPTRRAMAPDELDVSVAPHHDGSLIQISAADRAGLMADLAGGVSLAGISILSARVSARDGVSSTLWEVTRTDVDPAHLELRLRRVLDGTVDLAERFSAAPGDDAVTTRVVVHPDSSPSATVVEVRATDRRGLVWVLSRAIADLGMEIRSAHLSTFGQEARDVFYVVDAEGRPLDEGQTERLTEALLPL